MHVTQPLFYANIHLKSIIAYKMCMYILHNMYVSKYTTCASLPPSWYVLAYIYMHIESCMSMMLIPTRWLVLQRQVQRLDGSLLIRGEGYVQTLDSWQNDAAIIEKLFLLLVLSITSGERKLLVARKNSSGWGAWNQQTIDCQRRRTRGF